MKVIGRTQVMRPDQPGDNEPHDAHHLLPAGQRPGGLVFVGRAQEPGEDQDPHDRLIPRSQRGAFPCGGQWGGADVVQVSQGLLGVLVDAAQDEEVGGDARVGRIMPVERRHPQVEAHLLAQEGDVGGHERDEERRPRDRTVDPRGGDRAPALDISQRRRGAVRRRVARMLCPCARRVGELIDGVDRQPLGNVVWIAPGQAHQNARDAEAMPRTRPDPRALNRLLRLNARVRYV